MYAADYLRADSERVGARSAGTKRRDRYLDRPPTGRQRHETRRSLDTRESSASDIDRDLTRIRATVPPTRHGQCVFYLQSRYTRRFEAGFLSAGTASLSFVADYAARWFLIEFSVESILAPIILSRTRHQRDTESQKYFDVYRNSTNLSLNVLLLLLLLAISASVWNILFNASYDSQIREFKEEKRVCYERDWRCEPVLLSRIGLFAYSFGLLCIILKVNRFLESVWHKKMEASWQSQWMLGTKRGRISCEPSDSGNLCRSWAKGRGKRGKVKFNGEIDLIVEEHGSRDSRFTARTDNKARVARHPRKFLVFF